MSKQVLPLLIFASLLCFHSVFAGELRYVVRSKMAGITFDEYPLWTDATWAKNCSWAVTGRGSKADQQKFCEDGFSGLKPKIGVVKAGTEVELLDSRACFPMAGVRVLTGDLKSETGCISADALSSIKPR